jgi:SAM-dependent methyltransferase
MRVDHPIIGSACVTSDPNTSMVSTAMRDSHVEGSTADASKPTTLRSNVEQWKQLQDLDYFENHPCYMGLRDFDQSTCATIETFTPLAPEMNVVVIGCGYGRETAHIAPRVRHVWGIDVSQKILDKAQKYLTDRGVTNFTPALSDSYKTDIPAKIDLVFSIVVMQHLTRDLVVDYFKHLGEKLNPKGRILVQFVEDFMATDEDADLRAYEPSINWTPRQILELSQTCKLKFIEVRTKQVTPTALWHWALLGAGEREAASG